MTQDANAGLVYLDNVRLSFPHIAAAHASAVGSTPKFSADFIMEPTHPGYAQFMARLQAVALAKFGAQADGVLQYANMDKKLRCYGAGEECIDPKTMLPYAGYPGMVYVKANNDMQPPMFGADGVQVMDARQFYGGCYVNAQVKPWPQDNAHGKTVRCELVGIQFHSDGEAFGVAPVDPASLFGAVPGAPAAVAPGVAGVAAAQGPVGAPAAIPGMPGAPALGVPTIPGGLAQPPAAPAVVGYDPAAYAAPTAQAPVPGVITPAQPVVMPAPPGLGMPPAQPGVAQPMAPPVGVPVAQVPGINPATGLPY